MTKFNPDKHHRRSIRLKNWDYKKAALYFVTICVNNRKNLFGEIKDGKMVANDAGLMIEKNWIDIFERFKNTRLNKYVIMPNHFHAIIQIVGVPLVGTLNKTGQPHKT
ncbi:MAG: hypothetical protein KAU17_10195, partial [Spirochaetales bacterium]|nr:hypothetical protein [Spirochaetales bacterium]